MTGGALLTVTLGGPGALRLTPEDPEPPPPSGLLLAAHTRMPASSTSEPGLRSVPRAVPPPHVCAWCSQLCTGLCCCSPFTCVCLGPHVCPQLTASPALSQGVPACLWHPV